MSSFEFDRINNLIELILIHLIDQFACLCYQIVHSLCSFVLPHCSYSIASVDLNVNLYFSNLCNSISSPFNLVNLRYPPLQRASMVAPAPILTPRSLPKTYPQPTKANPYAITSIASHILPSIRFLLVHSP